MRDLPIVRNRAVSLLTALLLIASLVGASQTSARAESCDRQPNISTGFTPLWDGQTDPTDQGWTHSGPGDFDVVADDEGCSLLSKGGLGLLWYDAARFSDFELKMQWRTEDSTDNSGVFFGFGPAGGNTHNLAISTGYEVQIREGSIGDGENQKTGSIYNNQRELQRAANPIGQWNDYSITVEENAATGNALVTVVLNEQVVNVFQATDAFRAQGAGHIGLQNHGMNDAVSFRDLQVRTLTDATAPTTTATLTSEGENLPSGWYTDAVDIVLDAEDQLGGSGVARTEYRLDGGDWTSTGGGTDVLFDGTQETFNQWKQAREGRMVLTPEGTMLTAAGLGMLWHPNVYEDMHLRFEWRDRRPSVTGASNSGVFVRFPDPDAVAAMPDDQRPACASGESRPAWVAIKCGQELQIYDGTTGEVQKTGSVYNFSPLNLEQAKPGTPGDWQVYEVRLTGEGDWTAEIFRNGELLQSWQNSPGLEASRAGDAPTDLRQFSAGHVGLQNHGFGDYIEFRNVTVQRLDEPEAIRIDEPGRHTFEYRSIDNAGNVEDTTTVNIDIDPAAPVTTASVDQPGGTGPATITLDPTDVGGGVVSTEYRIDGGSWIDYEGPSETLLGTSQASFDMWRQAGPGSFERQPDGSIVSRGGLGMLWHPKEFGDARIEYQWRDLRVDGGRSNSGLFVRFPDADAIASLPAGDPARPACAGNDTRPEWIAIFCGQELQMYDGDSGETQKTGSVYNFQALNLEQARPVATGVWSTYTVELIGDGDYTATISRDGQVINTFTNVPGLQSSRNGDPGTSDRQFASGHVGLQNHGGSDVVQIRQVKVTDLSPAAAAFVIDTPGTHTVEFRSTDAAGRVEAINTLTITV